MVGVLGLTAVGGLVFADGETSKDSGASNCEHSLLGLRPWYSGLEMDDKCVIQSPGEEEMPRFVWTIVLNVLADVFIVTGYLAIGFVIYGGMLYIMSAGEPGKVARGKQVLTSATIGLILSILATVIINIITSVLSEATK